MRQVVGPSNTFAGGRLCEGARGGGPYEEIIGVELCEEIPHNFHTSTFTPVNPPFRLFPLQLPHNF